MPLSVVRCEELGVLRCDAPQEPRDEAGAGDKGTQGVTLQPVHASLSGSPDLDCKAMKSLENF